MKKNIIQRTLALVLTIAALAMTQAAMAVSTFTIEPEGNSNTFKIRRSDTSKAETVKYYTISLSALAGVHFTKTDGEYTFPVGIDSYSVTVPETAVNNIDAKYLYYSGSGHTYRFLVADKNGFEYAHLDRTLTYDGYALTNDSPFGVKDVVIQSTEYTADDDGYDVNGYKSVSSSDYFNNAAPKGYFSAIGAQLRMTLSFEAKENDDAYEYLQLLVDNTSTCDNRSGSSNGDPGNINLSKYMAGFEMNTGAQDDTYRSYTFPVLSAGDNEGATNPWNHGTNWPLSKQKFNGNRATDGRIIIPTDFSTLVLRLNASGKSGSDEWAAKNVKAHIQAVDNTAPTLKSITLAGGTYVRNTSCYITLAFSEPVIVTDTPELDTSWGSLAYLSGSGTNVLTFYRNELNGIDLALTVYSLMNVNQVSDLAGNAFSGTVSKSFPSVSAQKITLFDDYVKFKDLAGSYPVSSTPAEPKPSIGVYCGPEVRSLSLNSSYTRTYSNNTESDIVPGTGIITITGTGIYTGTVSAEFNTRWATSSVVFKKNHDGPTITMTDQTFTYNQPQALRANIMTRSGYAFNGWNTEANGSGTAYADKQEFTNPSGTGSFTNGATLTLYAQWTPNQYTVTLDNQSATTAGTASVTATYDAALPSITPPTRTYYTFGGYYTEANGGGTQYYHADGTSANAWHIAEPTTLYAQWTPISYTITYNLAGGTVATTNPASYNFESENIILVNPTREGYIFAGWTGTGLDAATETVTIPTGSSGDRTYTAQWIDVWGMAGGANGQAGHPYVITTTAGLDLLASKVNSGNSYSGNYFKLGADIAYDPTALDANGENYTAIGNISTKFQGTFDGDGHTISGIRINKTGSTDADRCQGLFGYIGYNGTVQNVILDDAHITGFNQVGGITGDMSSASIKNCLVLNTAIVTDGNSSNVGAISGINSGTFTANYYHNCSLTKDGTTKTSNIGANNSDRDGARSVHALTLPDGVSATGESVVIDGVTYYASNTTITLAYSGEVPVGNTSYGYSVNGSPIGGNTFTMPVADATVNVHWSVAYFDAADNSDVIDNLNGKVVDVVLSGRTLYKDGDWNTLCLPFSLTAEQVAASPLAGWTLMELDTDAGSYGHITGFENSALYLNFKPATSIVAGTPYIVKWIAQPDLTISSVEEWNTFCENVNNGTSYAGKTVRLAADISVSTMVGTYYYPFEGTFDGDGHTLTVTLNNNGATGTNDASYGVAPFRFTSGATIKNLHVGGTITTSTRKYAAGIVGMTKSGTNNIQNCRVSAEINSTIDGDGTHGGFVGKACGEVNISNCLFGGVLTTSEGNITHSCGGFVGWRDDPCTLDISNSLYAPADLPNGKYAIGTNNSCTFTRNNDECVSDCYYTTVLGDAQGTNASAMSNDQLLTALGDGWINSNGKVVPKKEAINITNPVFYGVTIENVNPEDRTVVSQDGKVSFTGTYDALSFDSDNRSILFLGADNTLYYPKSGASIGACRAYFQLNGISAADLPAGNVKMFFGEGDDTDGLTPNPSPKREGSAGAWYTIDGRRVSGKPTQKGIYVNNGRKVVMK